MRVAWNKGGLRCSLWVTMDQMEHVSSGSRVHKYPVMGSDQDGTQVGLPVISFPEPTDPSRMEVGESPTLGDLRPLSQEAYTLVMSKEPHKTSDAQDITSDDVDLAEKSPTPPKKADIARQQAPLMAASSATKTEMNCHSTKASVMESGPFFDGFHARASPTKLDRAITALFHTTRTDLVSDPPTEHMGSPAETSMKAESLISGGLCVDEPPFTLGKVETEGDRALKGLKLSNYVWSPPRVGIEE